MKGRTKEEILYTDFKSFSIADKKFGLSQIFTMNIEEVINELEDYVKLVNTVSDNNNYQFVCLFVTDIINDGSYAIYSDGACDIVKEAFGLDKIYQGIFVKNILSRKKQILPLIMNEMENR